MTAEAAETPTCSSLSGAVNDLPGAKSDCPFGPFLFEYNKHCATNTSFPGKVNQEKTRAPNHPTEVQNETTFWNLTMTGSLTQSVRQTTDRLLSADHPRDNEEHPPHKNPTRPKSVPPLATDTQKSSDIRDARWNDHSGLQTSDGPVGRKQNERYR